MKRAVDPLKPELIKVPKDGRLKSVRKEGTDLIFTFQTDENRQSQFFNHAADSAGKKIAESMPIMSSRNDQGLQELHIPYLSTEAAPGLIQLEFVDYPARITGKVKIPIKR